MTCCGRLVDISEMDDREDIWLCTNCGRQGHARDFPDPPEPVEPKLTRLERARFAIARTLVALAERIAP